jgi:hypothetical protein
MWLIAALIIFGVALARMYLGMHFLGDVVAGALVGLIVLVAFVAFEPGVTRWIAPKPIGFQFTTAFIASLLMLGTMLIVRSMSSGISGPIEWAQLSSPIALRSLNTQISDAAILFDAGAGLALLQRSGSFNARGPWSQRLLRLALRLIVLLILRFGLGAVFLREPELPGAIFRYVR